MRHSVECYSMSTYTRVTNFQKNSPVILVHPVYSLTNCFVIQMFDNNQYSHATGIISRRRMTLLIMGGGGPLHFE